MTGSEIINRALSLLGYAESDNNLDLTRRVMNRALPLVNIVYRDIRRICDLEPKEIKTLSEEIEIPENAKDIMACGLAGYIAGSEGDDYMQSFWSAEYQTRRTTLSKLTECKDVLPKVYG